MKVRYVFLGLLFLLILVSCTDSVVDAPVALNLGELTELNVFAAASLTEAFTEIGQAFEAEHPGVRVSLNFAGSQQLAQQIAEGAPADVFASANQKQMDVATSSGRILAEGIQIFAYNRLVVVYPKDSSVQLEQLQDLALPGLKLVLAAADVPVGRYTLDFLDKAAQDSDFGGDYPDNVLANVVSYEVTVKSVLGKVALGEADAGVVYNSDVIGPNAEKVVRLEIPDALNILATYPLVALEDSQQPELAQMFVSFVLGEKGQDILTRFGLIPVGER